MSEGAQVLNKDLLFAGLRRPIGSGLHSGVFHIVTSSTSTTNYLTMSFNSLRYRLSSRKHINAMSSCIILVSRICTTVPAIRSETLPRYKIAIDYCPPAPKQTADLLPVSIWYIPVFVGTSKRRPALVSITHHG